MPKVYVVVEDSKKNLTPAMDFGDVEVVLPEDTQLTFAPQPAVEVIRRKMSSYTAEDYIVAVGDPVAIGAVCAAAALATGGRFTVLKWDRQEKRYIPVRVDLGVRYERFSNGVREAV